MHEKTIEYLNKNGKIRVYHQIDFHEMFNYLFNHYMFTCYQ